MSTPSPRNAFAALLVLFVVSRLLLVTAGVQFDTSSIYFFSQYIDPALLRADLWRSIYYLHSQPPLFNLFLGLLVQLPASLQPLLCVMLWGAAGGTIAGSCYWLMIRLGVPVPLSFLLAAGFFLSPSSILYENWLFYTYPIAAALSLAALFLHRWVDSHRTRDLVGFLGLLTLVVLTRTLFHVVWFLLVVIVLAWRHPTFRRQIILVSALPGVILLALLLKNLLLFGTPGTSSWFGMNVARITTQRLPEPERQELVAQGTISPVSAIRPFSELRMYPPSFRAGTPTGVPALDQEIKSTGRTNFNNVAFIGIARQYSTDALGTIAVRPTAYLNGLVAAYATFFMPASDYWFQNGNRASILGYELLYNRFVLWQMRTRLDLDQDGGARKGWFDRVQTASLLLVILIPGVLIYSVVRLRRGRSMAPADRETLIYLISTVALVMFVGNAIDCGENNRFRFEVDPLILVMAGWTSSEIWRRWFNSGGRWQSSDRT